MMQCYGQGCRMRAVRSGHASAPEPLNWTSRRAPSRPTASPSRPVAELRHELAELVPGVGERDGLRALGHAVAGQGSRAGVVFGTWDAGMARPRSIHAG